MVFRGGAFPIATNLVGAVDNIVSVSTTVASLVFTNYGGTLTNLHTIQINANQTLTVNGLVTVGFAAKTVTEPRPSLARQVLLAAKPLLAHDQTVQVG